MEYMNQVPVRMWSESERPREKLMIRGKDSLSDAELLAILLGTGTRRLSSVDLARKILREAGDSLNGLSKLGMDELLGFDGIGHAKAITILAAMEIGQRRRSSVVQAQKRIQSSRDIYELMQPHLGDAGFEEFWVILLNRANRLIRELNISEGGFSGTVADPKKIFHLALLKKASSIILCHNHPSGNVNPSESDIQLTRKVKEAGALLDLPVLDHLIFGHNGYFSFADEGIL
jgi:DNA repair protein RadC